MTRYKVFQGPSMESTYCMSLTYRCYRAEFWFQLNPEELLRKSGSEQSGKGWGSPLLSCGGSQVNPERP